MKSFSTQHVYTADKHKNRQIIIPQINRKKEFQIGTQRADLNTEQDKWRVKYVNEDMKGMECSLYLLKTLQWQVFSSFLLHLKSMV